MHLSTAISYPASADAVARMLADPAFVEAKVARSGAVTQSTSVAHEPKGAPQDRVPRAFRVSIRRAIPTADLPIKALGFIGATLEVRQVEAWEAAENGERTGTMTVEIVGAPVRFVGRLQLAGDPDNAGHTRLSVDGDLKASVPLFGGAIEDATAPALTAAMSIEHEVGLEWLAEHESE